MRKAYSSRRAVQARALALLVPLTAGCGSAVGQVSTYATGAVDKGSLSSALDAPLAVGGDVRPALHFDLRGSAAPSTHLLSARPDVVEVRNGLLVGKSPGMSAVLVAMDGDVVVDFLHVWVKAADHIEVHGIDTASGDMGAVSEPIELVVGDGMHFSPHAYAGSEQLIGVGASSWVVDPPIAVVLREGLPNRVHLVAKTPGTADVKVTMLGATTHLTVKVIS
jgi:hypothetical protein